MRLNLIPADEDSKQWSAYFIRMARGEKVDINDKNLQTKPVEGIPPNLEGPEGQLHVPEDVSNVDPAPQSPPPTPSDVYIDAIYNKMKQKRYKQKKKRKTGSTKRKGGVKKRSKKKRKSTKRKRTSISKKKRR